MSAKKRATQRVNAPRKSDNPNMDQDARLFTTTNPARKIELLPPFETPLCPHAAECLRGRGGCSCCWRDYAVDPVQ